MRRFFIGIVVLAVAGGTFSPASTGQAVAQGEAHVRFGHFSPGMGEVDVYIDRALTGDPALKFGAVTDWLPLAAGAHRVIVSRSADPVADALLDASFDLAAGQRVTLAIIGEVIQGTAQLFPLVEDYTPIAQGETRITFLHAIPDLGLVDIAQADGTPLVSGLGFPGTVSAGQGWDGSAQLDLIGGGRVLAYAPRDTPGMIMLQSDFVLNEGANHLLVLAGLRASPVTILAATIPETEVMTVDGELVGLGSGEALVRAGNFASGAGELAVFVDGESFADDALLFGDSTDWLTLTAGEHEFAVASAGTPYENAIIIAPEVPVATGSRLTLAVVGLIPADGGQIYVLAEDPRPVQPGEARLTVLHAMPDLGPVSVWLDGEVQLFVALDFPGIDGPPDDSVDLVAGTRTLELRPFDDPDSLALDLPPVALAAGTRNVVVVAGLQANPAIVLLTDEGQ
ncbi:MAG: DUF4397 domain-containing protein [Anaerolineae bacterium]|nr:DUF4397 domain-containing protein [Anaerolineae bacterium]